MLGLAVAASVATSVSLPALYSDDETTDEVWFWLYAPHPERVWLITCAVDVPAVARTHPFSSWLSVNVVLDHAPVEGPIEVVLWDAHTFETLDEGIVGVDGGLDVHDAFDDCLPGGCERAFFLYVSSPEDVEANLWWVANASIVSDDIVDDESDAKPTAINIEYEELVF